jgi:hypothetical protein
MRFHGTSAAQQAHALAMIIDDNHRSKEEVSDGPSGHRTESPTLAGYIVYVITVFGFGAMCALSAWR